MIAISSFKAHSPFETVGKGRRISYLNKQTTNKEYKKEILSQHSI